MNQQGWETMIATRLRLLAAADKDNQAPPRVEAALRAAYRQYYRPRRAVWPWIAAWGSVAAAVLVLWTFTAARRRSPSEPAIENRPAPAAPARLEAKPAPLLPVPRRAARPKRYNASARSAPAPAKREIATEFLSLVDTDLGLVEDNQQVVRVRLPRAALASFGLPVEEEDAGGRVQADVVLGGDGMARAIRFVRVSQVRE